SGTRYAFVNLEYILNNIPDYAKAQEELNHYSQKLQAEIDAVYVEVAELQGKYNADKVFMTPSMREQREKEIAAKENKARLLQQQYFGTNGVLFAKREELVKPLQDEVLAVIKDIAKEGNFGMIIDVAADNSVVYYDPKLDKSNIVLRKLGYSVKKVTEE
ncbi:MAG: OmpH family outer membrane protein, partial [Odoribacter sp.]